ncbi:hypothetical protein BC940DRAFT_302791 [Gongronella butleri]|nr:hypothetical protein BC940DRAFT_302791 [Gongronella butleri]
MFLLLPTAFMSLAGEVFFPLTMGVLFIVFCLALWKLSQFKSQPAKRTIYIVLAATCVFGIISRGMYLISIFDLPVMENPTKGRNMYRDYFYPQVIFLYLFDVGMSVIPAVIVHFCLIATSQTLYRSVVGWLVIIDYAFVILTAIPPIIYLASAGLAYGQGYQLFYLLRKILPIIDNGLFLIYPLSYIYFCAKYASSYRATYVLYCIFQTLYIIYPWTMYDNSTNLSLENRLQISQALSAVFFAICPCLAAIIAVFFVPQWKWKLEQLNYSGHGYMTYPYGYQAPPLTEDRFQRPLPPMPKVESDSPTPNVAPKTEIP